jgi:hypothetical protein
MLATTTDRTVPAVEDVTGVKSRISWAAILGGAAITLAAYLVLTFLCAAVGLSLTETTIRGETLAIGSVVAAIVVMAGSLFLGGWITTQLSVGENTREAVIYGVLTWAVVTALSLALIGTGIRAGYMALMGSALVAQNDPQVRNANWEELARDAGVTQEKINEVKQATDPNRVRTEAADPANQEKARQTSIATAWALLGGTLVSIGAAVGGAVVGKGASFRLFATTPVAVQRTEIIRS